MSVSPTPPPTPNPPGTDRVPATAAGSPPPPGDVPVTIMTEVEAPAVPSGPPRPFSQQWGEALCSALNASEAYRTTAARWIWPVALVVQKSAELGWARDTAVVLSLEHGHCNGVRLVDGNKARAPFIFRGSYANWKRVLHGDVDPIVAMVKGELAVTGSMSTIMMHSRAAKSLIEVARTVEITEL